MASLFFSYSRKDIDFARKLTEAFKGQDLDFWIDWEGIPPTVDWWKEIEKGIEEADIFLFLLSPDSAKSKVCRQEIEHAAKNGKRLIPVVIRDVNADDAPVELKPLNWIFLRENDDFNDAFGNKLMAAIKTDYEWVQTHRQLQVKALEWERSGHENSFLLRGKELQDAELQFATNSSKEPYPTDLQRDYALKSRQATDRQRRVITSIAIAGVIALAALAAFGFIQAGLAREAQATAESNLVVAQTAQANAINKQALADSNAATAVTNEQEAKRQTRIALARQLAAQAQSIFGIDAEKQTLGGLLAVQSIKMLPTTETSQLLQNMTITRPVIRINQVNSVAFSPDSKYLASGGCFKKELNQYVCDQGIVRIWETATGHEVAKMFHDSDVTSIAFSPDGRYIISSGCKTENNSSYCSQSTARVWEIATGKIIAYMIYGSEIEYVAFSPDGKAVISREGNTIHIWNISTETEIAHTTLDSDDATVAFSTNGRYVVSEGCYKFDLAGPFCIQSIIRVWDIVAHKEVANMIYDSVVTSVAISPDGKCIVSGSGDGTISVWDKNAGKEISQMHLDSYVTSVAFSPDSKYVVSGAGPGDSTARTWEVVTGNEVARITYTSPRYVTSVAFSPDKNYVASGDGDLVIAGGNTVRIWESFTGKEIARMIHDSNIESVTFSPDGNYVASMSYDTVLVSEVIRNKEIYHMSFDGDVTSVAFSPNGKYIISGGCESKDDNSDCIQGSTRIWEIASGKEIARVPYKYRVISVAFSPDGRYIISAGCETNNSYSCTQGTARVWEIATRKEIAHITHQDTVSSIALSPDGKYIISGSWDNTARVWEAATSKEVAIMTHDSEVSSVAFSPDGKYVVSGSYDGIVILWEATTGKEISRTTLDSDVRSNEFSPNGAYVVSGGCSKRDLGGVFCIQGVARVWEAMTGREVSYMRHDDFVTTVAFSRDGKYVVSGSNDGAIRLWEATTGNEITRMNHDYSVNSVVFNSDGKYVASGSKDGTTRIWKWQPEDLIASACSRISRNLTRAEWEQYIGDILPYQAVCKNLPIEVEVTPTP